MAAIIPLTTPVLQGTSPGLPRPHWSIAVRLPKSLASGTNHQRFLDYPGSLLLLTTKDPPPLPHISWPGGTFPRGGGVVFRSSSPPSRMWRWWGACDKAVTALPLTPVFPPTRARHHHLLGYVGSPQSLPGLPRLLASPCAGERETAPLPWATSLPRALPWE